MSEESCDPLGAVFCNTTGGVASPSVGLLRIIVLKGFCDVQDVVLHAAGGRCEGGAGCLP
eukprot:5588076-Pleurochrysis_carterae.AAC.1